MPHDWVVGLAGGLIIGIAAAIYLLVNGRIMGASGIIGTLVDGSGTDSRLEKVSFLVGLILVAAVFAGVFGHRETHLIHNPIIIIAGGLMVGLGTRLANGCTSGHGVCGISRLSIRGIVATVLYIFSGGVTVLLFRHVLGVI